MSAALDGPVGLAAPAARPGFAPERMVRLMRDAVARCGLDLSGLCVLTEAATGAYAVTAPLAALAGAERVIALARGSRHGSAAAARAATLSLAALAGVAGRIEVLEALPRDLGAVDIVTNSGHLRPLDAALIARLPQAAVIALMFEAWELREGDIDLRACRARGIPVVGVNERHPAVDVFSYLGPLCLHALQAAGLPVHRNRIALLCDNDFGPPVLRSLVAAGAEVAQLPDVEAVPPGDWDAIVVALQPGAAPRIAAPAAARLARAAPGALVLQVWGDVERAALAAHGLRAWPPQPPAPGHMGVLLSEIGPDPVVRLQAGGLRAAEWVRRGLPVTAGGFAQPV